MDDFTSRDRDRDDLPASGSGLRTGFVEEKATKRVRLRAEAQLLKTQEGTFQIHGAAALSFPRLSSLAESLLQKLTSAGIEQKEWEESLDPAHPLSPLSKVLLEGDLVRLEESNPKIGSSLERVHPYINEYRSDAVSCLELVAKKHVAIVGCGRTGSNLAMMLVASGLRNFTLIDFDTVQVSNLNRQTIFEGRHLEKPKVEALSDALSARCEEALHLNRVHKRLTSETDLQSILRESPTDLLLGCADQPPLEMQRWLVRASLDRGVPVYLVGQGFAREAGAPF